MTARLKHSRAGLLALALTLALAAPAAASDSKTSNETLAIPSQITLAAVPAAIDYGTTLGNETRTGTPSANLSASTNNPTGLTLSLLGSDLTNGNGGTIAKTARSFVGSSPTNCNLMGGAVTWSTSTPKAHPATGSLTICSTTAAGTSSVTIQPRLTVPSNQIPGSYTGTIVWTATENP